MATAVETNKPRTLDPEQRVVLRGISWEGYETILALVGDHAAVRLAYDRGTLEFMSPSQDHEFLKTRIGRLIETLTMELNLPCEGLGSTTWRKKLKQCGLEPDECYYLANSARIVGRKTIDLAIDPPPDLAVEIEISRSAVDRLTIYGALGVPEVWRFDGEILRVEQLQAGGSYTEVASSRAFPFLSLDEIVHWIRLAEDQGQTPWIRQFQAWVRNDLLPRLGDH